MTYNKSQIFQNASDEFLGQATQPSSQIMPEPDKPVSQQSFSMRPNKTDLEMPTVDVQPTFVPGIGVLGADIEGVTKGLEARQRYRLAEEANIRANENVGIEKAKLGQAQDYLKIAQAKLGISLDEASQQRNTYDQEQAIQAGMVNAAKTGGYQGAIDYLKGADPAKAILFETAKLKLDDDIMKNETIQAQAPAERQKALLETYGLMGKFSASIMSAPPEVQDSMYQQTLPIFNKFGIKMPNKLNNQARGIMTLMTAQGQPENVSAQYSNMANYLKNDTVKLYEAYNTAVKLKGEDSPEAAQIKADIDANRLKTSQASIQAAQTDANLLKTQTNIKNANTQIAMKCKYKLDNDSSEFKKEQNKLKDISTNFAIYNQAINSGKPQDAATALIALSYSMAHANNGAGVLTEADYQNTKAAGGWSAISNNVKSWVQGSKNPLQDWEVKQALALTQLRLQKSMDIQQTREQVWQDAAQKNGDTVSWVLPTQIYQQQVAKTLGLGSAEQGATQTQQPTYTREQIDSMAQQAVQAGKPVQAVEQMKQQLYQQNGIQ